jgi:predicted nucleic acid-binding protein
LSNFIWKNGIENKLLLLLSRRFVSQLLSLNLLPEQEIHSMFDHLTEKADGEKLVDLVEYVSNTWMRSTLWPPARWLNYGMPS